MIVRAALPLDLLGARFRLANQTGTSSIRPVRGPRVGAAGCPASRGRLRRASLRSAHDRELPAAEAAGDCADGLPGRVLHRPRRLDSLLVRHSL